MKENHKDNISEIKRTLFGFMRKVSQFVKDIDIYGIICPLCRKELSFDEAKKCTVKKSGCCLVLSNFL